MAQIASFEQLTKQRRRARRSSAEGINTARGGFDDARGRWQGQYDFGQESLGEFKNWLSGGGDVTDDPSYKWRLGEGTRNLESSAAAKGGLMSGNALRAISDYGQQSASQEYGNVFNRYMQRMGLGERATGAMAGLDAGGGMAIGGMQTAMGQQNFNNAVQAWKTSAEVGEKANNVAQSWMGGS